MDDKEYYLIHIPSNTLSKIREAGFDGDTISTDGEWFVGDKFEKEDCSVWINNPELTDYMKAIGISGCCLTNEKAAELVLILASVKGASDGFSWWDVIE